MIKRILPKIAGQEYDSGQFYKDRELLEKYLYGTETPIGKDIVAAVLRLTLWATHGRNMGGPGL